MIVCCMDNEGKVKCASWLFKLNVLKIDAMYQLLLLQ